MTCGSWRVSRLLRRNGAESRSGFRCWRSDAFRSRRAARLREMFSIGSATPFYRRSTPNRRHRSSQRRVQQLFATRRWSARAISPLGSGHWWRAKESHAQPRGWSGDVQPTTRMMQIGEWLFHSSPLLLRFALAPRLALCREAGRVHEMGVATDESNFFWTLFRLEVEAEPILASINGSECLAFEGRPRRHIRSVLPAFQLVFSPICAKY